jgi:hypothetical protein
MPIVKLATAAFRRPPERLNCAQAILHAHQTVRGCSIAPIADFKPFGSGRAPEGECGALYAACRVAPHAAESMRAAFVARMGTKLCRDLKAFACQDCVAMAAELLQHYVPLA